MEWFKEYIKGAMEELRGAREYAEKYCEHKRNGEDMAANKYKEMAKQELGHASQLLDMACAATGDGPEATAMKMMCSWIREELDEDKADIMRMLDHVGAW